MVSRLGTLTDPSPVLTSPTAPRPTTAKFATPKPNITLPPNLGRPPRATDLIIKRGFDGITPDAAVRKITANLTNALAPQNRALVESTARDRHRDFNVALNNVFTPNTPNRQFLEGLNPTSIAVIGTMSAMTPVVYEVKSAGQLKPKFYARDWSGRFSEIPKPPGNVVMSARVRLEPPGLSMSYPKWTNPALSGPLTTITEL